MRHVHAASQAEVQANRKAGAMARAVTMPIGRPSSWRVAPRPAVRAASSRFHVRAASQAAATANESRRGGVRGGVATRKANATGGEGAWTDGEENKFRTAVGRFGRDWVRVAAAVGTRDCHQCHEFSVGKDYVPPARRPRRDRARTRRRLHVPSQSTIDTSKQRATKRANAVEGKGTWTLGEIERFKAAYLLHSELAEDQGGGTRKRGRPILQASS